MKHIDLFVVLFLFFNSTFFSQNEYKHGFLSYGTETEEKGAAPNYKLYAKQVHKKYDTLFRDKEERDEFAKVLIGGLHNEMENGNVYTNWEYATTYLNKVFKNILPASNTDTLNIKIIRSTDVNAFMTGTGQAYMTVGFLANAINEAEIASVLGHEYGHYANLDIYKRYKEYLKNQKHHKIGSLLGLSGAIFYLISTSTTFGNFRDMERDADKTGLELAQNANYNLLAALNVEKRFKLIEDNYGKTKDYRHHFYFHTHPPTKERIEYTQEAAQKSDTVNAKYFLVDENLFQKIRSQAIDECINLLLQEQEFEDCIEFCYKQLLFNPNDEFYLFYLNESLRRYILARPIEAEKIFITGRYTTRTTFLSKDELPVLVISEKHLKPTDLRVGQTIFYHYEYLMLADQNGLLTKLPSNELTRTDTLEFVSNRDALIYFTNKQEKLKQSSVSWVKNCTLKTLQNISINSSESFLNRYNNIKNDLLTCLLEDEPKATSYMVLQAGYSGNSALLSRPVFDDDSLPKQCARFLKTSVTAPFTYFNLTAIDHGDRHVFQKFIKGMIDYTFKFNANNNPFKSEKIERLNLPMALITPEVVTTLNKYKLQQFIATDIEIIDALTVSMTGTPLSYFVILNIYYFDFKTGFHSHVMKKETITSYSELKPSLEKLNQHFSLSMLKK